MNGLTYKEKLAALRQSGLTDLEISRLEYLRQGYVTTPLDMTSSDLARLCFVRWLAIHGRLNKWPNLDSSLWREHIRHVGEDNSG